MDPSLKWKAVNHFVYKAPTSISQYGFQGDLKSYLRKHRDQAQEMAHQDLQLKMAADMISGLMWLHQADFIYMSVSTLYSSYWFFLY